MVLRIEVKRRGLQCDTGKNGGELDDEHDNDRTDGLVQVFSPSNSSTAAAVTFITFVQDLKRKTKTWGPMIELCANGEKTLERFRYQFPDDWLYSDQLRGEWSAYNEILKRKSDSIQEQLGTGFALVLSR